MKYGERLSDLRAAVGIAQTEYDRAKLVLDKAKADMRAITNQVKAARRHLVIATEALLHAPKEDKPEFDRKMQEAKAALDALLFGDHW